jgi:hypothetical protein
VLPVWYFKDRHLDMNNKATYTVHLMNDTTDIITELEAKLNCPKKLKAFNDNQEHMEIDED